MGAPQTVKSVSIWVEWIGINVFLKLLGDFNMQPRLIGLISDRSELRVPTP